MPRIPRGIAAEGIYHIINRGNMRMKVFDDQDDYEYFLELLKSRALKEKIAIHAYCIMPNHFHLLVSLMYEGNLSRWMHLVMTSHVRYYHKKNKTSGHIWQGRYKSFIVEKDSYYSSTIRYIEANAQRAELVKQAQEWEYGSLYERVSTSRNMLCEPLLELGDDWVNFVNQPMRIYEIQKIRNSVNRQAPLGEEGWQIEVAAQYGLLSTLQEQGRPRKVNDNE